MKKLLLLLFSLFSLLSFANLRLISVMGNGLRSFPDLFSMTPVAITAAVVPVVRFGKSIPFTVAHWTKVTVLNNTSTLDGGSIVGMINNNTGWGWDIYNAAAINGDTGFGFQPRLSFADQNTVSVVGVEPSAIVTDGNWHFTVTTYNGANSGTPTNDIHIWIDNVSKATQNDHDNSIVGDWNTSTNPFVLGGRIGGSGTVHNFNGLTDMVSVWDTELSSSQIAQLYNAGTPLDVRTVPFASHCVYFAPIGEGSDTTSTIHDLINGNDMTGTGVTFSGSIP